MRNQYFPPKFSATEFHCIRCRVYASQQWYDTYLNNGIGAETSVSVSECAHCKGWTYWHQERMIIPAEAPVEIPHPDLPEDCVKDYIEARNIFVQSPRASAALLRLCIQKLMPYLGEKGENINADIKSRRQRLARACSKSFRLLSGCRKQCCSSRRDKFGRYS